MFRVKKNKGRKKRPEINGELQARGRPEDRGGELRARAACDGQMPGVAAGAAYLQMPSIRPSAPPSWL